MASNFPYLQCCQTSPFISPRKHNPPNGPTQRCSGLSHWAPSWRVTQILYPHFLRLHEPILDQRMAAAAVDPIVLRLATSGGGVVGGGVGGGGRGGSAVMDCAQLVGLAKHPSGIVPTLQNIVSTVNLDCRLDVKQIALQARNVEYNPKRFAAVIMRELKTTTLIFASGKMVCTGS